MSNSKEDYDNSVDVGEMRQKFEEKLNSIKISLNSHLIKDAKAYSALIAEVETAKSKTSKATSDYRRIKRYDVLGVDGGKTKKLIVPLSKNKGIVYYVHNEQLFDIIHEAHMQTGHGGKNKIAKIIKSKYANVTRETLIMYLEVCKCREMKMAKRKERATAHGRGKGLSEEINTRARIDLVDMQTSSDGEYVYILHYQEEASRFVCVRPLKTNTPAEIAHNLLDIFSTIGAPAFLQADDDEELCESIIDELRSHWLNLNISYEEPNEPNLSQHEDTDEGPSNADKIRDMIVFWMEYHNLTTWSKELHFYQWEQNTCWSSAIKNTPYEAMFGRKVRSGFQTVQMPSSVEDIEVKEEDMSC